MTISFRLNDKESDLFKRYAEMKNVSMSELVRQAVLEKIEDDMDLTAYNKAMEDYTAEPVTYSHDDVKKLLDL